MRETHGGPASLRTEVWFGYASNDWNPPAGPEGFEGLDNCITELNDPFFWNSLLNTFSIVLLSSIPQLIGAVPIAVVLDQNIRPEAFWRMSVPIP